MHLIAYLISLTLSLHMTAVPKPEPYRASCSAVWISSNTALSCAHCFEDEQLEDTALVNTEKHPFVVLKKDTDLDLALIQVEGPAHKYVKLGAMPKLNSSVVVVSNPLNILNCFSKGYVVNVINVKDVTYILHSALIDHGSSGSGLFNRNGELIGINSGILHAYYVAISISDVRRFLNAH